MSNHTNHPTALNFARQRGITVGSSDPIQADTALTVASLRELAIADGLPVNTKTRKADIIALLNEANQDASVDLSKLTARQARRVRKRLAVAS